MFYAPSTARSFPTYPPYLPNRAYTIGSDNTSKPCITCHNNPDGGQGCQPSSSWPCLNPFGSAFASAGRSWSPTLASGDADGDGFTNGQELQDPLGTWIPGTLSPGNPAYVTRPGFSAFSPGQTDADLDGYCYFGHDLNGDRDCLDASENTTDRDCNDSAGTVHTGAPELCTNAEDDDCNGFDTFSDSACAMYIDHDRDGYCPVGQDMNADRDCTDNAEANGQSDCDDYNVLVRPNAAENCSDVVDNDCDTKVDAADPNCTGEADADSDGYCPIGRDTTDDTGSGPPDGDCLDASEPAQPSDCNDYESAIYPGAAEVCGDLQDNNCNALADFADAGCAADADTDGDGYCLNGKDVNHDGNCASLNGGTDVHNTSMGWDCNDDDANVFSLAVEDCLDGIDQDCDLLIDLQDSLGDTECARYLDRDHDHYCPVGGMDKNSDYDCADGNESSFYSDCDDERASVSPLATEDCFNHRDDDCNGSTDASAGAADPNCYWYTDWDYDGYCGEELDPSADPPEERKYLPDYGRDTVHDDGSPGRDGDCADAGEQTSVHDWFPNDATISPGNHESCFDYKDNDQDEAVDLADFDCDPANPASRQDVDHDGYCPVGRDVNGDGDCLDGGENYGQSDCDETDPLIGPQMAEIYIEDAATQRCFDADDNDCDGKVDLADPDCHYLFDDDEDGVCGHGRDDNEDGDCLDTAEQRAAADCDDDDPQRASIFQENCTNGVDDDCDDLVDLDDARCRCQLDSECTGFMECQVGRCNEGVCSYIPDPTCTQGSPPVSGVCGVSAPGSAPRPSFAAVLLGLAILTSITLRRRFASIRAGR